MSWNYKEKYIGKNNPESRDNGCVLEHVIIASELLGRPLNDSEVVHHIDENPSNNSKNNLMVFKTNKDHLRYHYNKVAELQGDGTYISPVLSDNSERAEDGSCRTYCIDCNTTIRHDSIRCRKCNSINNRITSRPDKEQLLVDIKDLGYCGTGRKYGVSDNTVRKWLK